MNQHKTNVLVIAPYRFMPAVNGGHKAIERLYGYLGTLTKVVVVSVKSNDDSAQGFRLAKVFSDSPSHYINPLLYFRLKKMIREEQITHIITEHPYMGWLAYLLKRTLPLRWVMRSHNIEAVRFKTIGKKWWKAMWRYEKWVCQKADKIFFITEEDKSWAAQNYSLPEQKGSIITFGIDSKMAPYAGEKSEASRIIKQKYGIPLSHRVLLFNGDLGYEPNEAAVRIILDHIYPLLQSSAFPFTILICGRNLKEPLVKRIKNANSNIIYAGFVDDIGQVFLGADVFINPVVSGGGIKTKLVEALGYNCSAVSTVSGATGMPLSVVDNKLAVVADDDWEAFVKAIMNTDTSLLIGNEFYNHFYWGNIAQKALEALESIQ